MLQGRASNLKVDLAFGILNTPFHWPMTPYQRYLSLKAKVFFHKLKSGEKLIRGPRDYRCYFFTPPGATKRAFVLHGWLSRAEHMTKIIKSFYDQGIEVVAIDLPAHGRSPGFKIYWKDTIRILLDVQNRYGKFDIALGHSYGGGLLLTSTGIANIDDEFEENFYVPQMILMGSPTKVKTPIGRLSKVAAMSETELHRFYEKIIKNDLVSPEHLDGLYLQKNFPTNTEFLCIHSKNDLIIPFSDAEYFSQLGERVQLIHKERLGHTRILNDNSVLDDIHQFICP